MTARDSQSDEESSKETEHGKGTIAMRSLYGNERKQIHAQDLYFIYCLHNYTWIQ